MYYIDFCKIGKKVDSTMDNEKLTRGLDDKYRARKKYSTSKFFVFPLNKIIYYISKIQTMTVVLVLHFTFTLMITYITTSPPGNIRVGIRILH